MSYADLRVHGVPVELDNPVPVTITVEIASVVGLATALDDIDTALDTKPTVVAAPAAADSTGVAGTIAYDATHFYVCVATDTWVRADLATWT